MFYNSIEICDLEIFCRSKFGLKKMALSYTFQDSKRGAVP